MISRDDGRVLAYIEQIRQSITDILTTPIGSRVMRRDYGSMLPDLIDRPLDDVLVLQCYSAIYSALLRYEDRIIIETIDISQVTHGTLEVDLLVHLTQLGIDTNLGVSVALV